MGTLFRTEVKIPHSEWKTGYQNQKMAFGSCFAENIGEKLQNACFKININPFGVLFNPLSVLQSIDYLLNNKIFDENDIFKYNSLWHSFNHSSKFSRILPEDTLLNINKELQKAKNDFQNADILIFTFGTAWIYQYIETGQTVANCHKLPAAKFSRRRLQVDEIAEKFIALLQKITVQSPAVRFIFTVSPVRHFKDGAVENNASKATLLLAVNEIVKNCKSATYFPAYEIMNDELRDYRFYAADMLHPSSVAIDYIWQRFSETFFDEETNILRKRLEQYYTAKSHRPLHPDTPEYYKFCEDLEKHKLLLISQFPVLKDRM
jgi:hypothetical protein